MTDFPMPEPGVDPSGSTTASGAPAVSDRNSLSLGSNGPLLLHDVHLVDTLAHFNRENVPERRPHAKGAGAFGEFETTSDVSAYTRAALFQQGAKTRMLARFSTVAGELGSPDTWRDVRGFALKFYTSEGNYDMVGNNTPVFFVRDPMKFPHFIRSQKRLPDSGLRDNHMQWDFWTLNPESSHQVTYLMGDLVGRLGVECPEVPLHVVVPAARVGQALLGADEVRELHGVPDEEYRGVVPDHVVVARGGVELQGEAAHVAPGVGGAELAGHRGEACQHARLRALLEQRRAGVGRDVRRRLELAEGAGALGVGTALGDVLAVEMGEGVHEVDVVQQEWAVRAQREGVAVTDGGGAAGRG